MSAPDEAVPRRRVSIRLIVGLLLVIGLIVLIGRLGEGADFLALVREARPAWLLAALGSQALTYVAEASVWQAVLRRRGLRRPLGELYRLALVALFTNQAVPTAGIGGQLLVVRTLEARGVPHAIALACVLVDVVGYYTAYAASVAVTFAVLRLHGALGWAAVVPAALFVVFGAVLAMGAVWIATPGRHLPGFLGGFETVDRAVRWLSRADPALVRAPGLVVRAALFRGVNVALDAFTLWTCLRAVGESVPAGAALVGYVLGVLARSMGLVPGGLGTFEAAAVGGLVLFGLDLEPALAAVLLYRGLSYWLPMLPGFLLGSRLAVTWSGDAR